MQKVILSIGSIDPSGCSGILADVKTIMAFRCYAATILTAVTSQNTQVVDGIYPIPLEMIGQQFDALVDDLEISAVKVGLIPYPKAIELVATLLLSFKLPNIVFDPIIRSSTGYVFLKDDSIELIKQVLIPICDVITPNLYEASVFTGMEVKDTNTMKDAAARFVEMGAKNVIIKGGHLEQRAIDCLYDGLKFNFFDAPKLSTSKTRGSGDTFSSIIALHLAKKDTLPNAINNAKKYLSRAMSHQFQIGKGSEGPLNHNVPI
jgi:hydroxymethylpyrimidine/phosphomethylpyrimidine kinase